MLKNHFSLAIRNLSKRKGFAFINISGLAISICAFLLIFEFISFEKSFDNFHSKGDRIYRIQYEKLSADNHDKSAGLAAGGGPALVEDFPEVQSFVKLWGTKHLVNILTVDNQAFESDRLFYATNSFFQFFDFEFVAGDPKTALEGVNSIVITESTAQRFYGRVDVLGEDIHLKNGMSNDLAQITGVIKDLPPNTHFDFDVLVSFESVVKSSGGGAANTFGWNAFPTYILLNEDVDAQSLEAKFPVFIEDHYRSVIEQGIQPIYKLMPLEDIYLKSDVRFEVGPTSSQQVLRILTGVSIFILVLAYFNYINLSTSQALERAKEVGVRKVTGATRSQLFTQFMTESFLFNLMSIVGGFTLMQFSKPYFADIIDRTFDQQLTIESSQVLALAIILILGTLISGFYPSWILSKLNTSEVLRGKSNEMGKTGFLKKSLVVIQFAILCFLLVGSLAVRDQIKYMLSADWGFSAEQVLVVKGPAAGNNDQQKFDSFINNIESLPQVTSLGHSSSVPGKEISWINNDVRQAGAPLTEATSVHFVGVNDGYLNALKLDLLAGRNFDRAIVSDTGNILLSKSAVKALGFKSAEEALNKKVVTFGQKTVVGVVEDYMQQSFKETINPTAYLYAPWSRNYFILKVSTEETQQLIDSIEKNYQESFAGNPFDFFFLDDFFQRQFQEDRVFARTFNLFTILGIWISCLGLIGLTSHAVNQRKKEIGIRKVLGASLSHVIMLISAKMIGLVFISVLLSIPLSYWAVNAWLQNYSFSTSLSPLIFTIPVVAVMVLTFITTSVLSVKTGLKDPIDSLRYD